MTMIDLVFIIPVLILALGLSVIWIAADPLPLLKDEISWEELQKASKLMEEHASSPE